MIKTCVSELVKTHEYIVNGEYWSRIGSMHKRFGEDTLLLAIKNTAPKEIPLTYMLNILEKKCQHIIENDGTLDELANDLMEI